MKLERPALGWLERLGLTELAGDTALLTPVGAVSRGDLCKGVLAAAGELHMLSRGQVAQLRFKRGDPRALVATLAVWERGGIPLFQDAADSSIRADAVAASVGAAVKVEGRTASTAASVVQPASLSIRWLEPSSRVDLGSDDPGYLIQTSGSSGVPRVSFNTSWGLRNVVDGLVERYGLAEGSRALQFAPFGYDAWLADALPSLQAGGSLAYGPVGEWSGFRMIERVVAEWCATHAVLPPSVWRRIKPLDCLQVAVSAGEALDVGTARALRATVPRVVNAYGPSEAAICSMTYEVAGDEAQIPLGDPIPGVEVSTVDDGNGRLLLRISGSGVAHGYVGEIGSHRDAGDGGSGWFGVDDHGRFFQTADVVSGAGTMIYFVGRADRMVKHHGRLVNLERVEAAVRALSTVVDCVVSAGDRSIVCEVLGVAQADAELRAALASALELWETPTEFRFVDELRRSSSDKLDLKSPSAPATAHAGVEPLHERVRALWVAIAGAENEGDSFFALGGDSLGAMELLDQVAGETGVEIDIADFVDNPTLDALLRLVGQWHLLG
jgi:acyl-coenzyme A synthetase/AMP-(fatty) acid ligase/acyl carrier protein